MPLCFNSGGQKARTNLARAVYADKSIYLLDDPLAAVDPGVAKKIFESCIRSYLAEKTVLLVTHSVQVLFYFKTRYLFVIVHMLHYLWNVLLVFRIL